MCTKLIWFILGLVVLSGCIQTSELIYLQGEKSELGVFTYTRQPYKLQVNDILDVQVKLMNPENSETFGNSARFLGQNAQAGVQSGGDLFFITGYSVNENGHLLLPFLDPISVEGLTLQEARDEIDAGLKTLFKNYYLQVKLGGVRFSTLGEFNSPGKRVILQNQVTIFEAISASGDLTPVANRSQVRLIRQYPEGTRVHTIDLLDEQVVMSPFYFIQPNDVLYVEPLKQKSWGIGVTGAQTLATVVSTLSTTLALTLSIISLNR